MKRLLVFLFVFIAGHAMAVDYYNTYPTHWWVGMKNQKLQLLMYGKEIGQYTKVVIHYPGVRVDKISKFENNNYLAVDLTISPVTRPGRFKIILSGGGLPAEDVPYELKSRSRENGKTRVQGISSKDFAYLMLPDRFANGNPDNDALEEYRDKTSDRQNKFDRHGGDLKGIQDHLDYFNELGVTALWFTPVTENDMPKMREAGFDMSGYHGYWFTDHYNVDKRLGGNDDYKSLINAAHQKGLKIIQDAIYNHIGLYHWINQDPPSRDWINQGMQNTEPNHKEETLFDPYASRHDKENMLRGWFRPHLPDVNLQNPYAATFLVQHAIWSVEEFGFDGFRIDTYKYCDEAFLNKMNAALLKEFPTVTTFVEAWVNSVVANAYFVENNIRVPFKHNAMGAIDFSLCFAMHDGMKHGDLNRIYSTLAQDIIYKNPLNNCIFLDNHDMDRVFSTIGEEWPKMKWGINWLLTLRGIPQLYYGTEILMKNFKNPTDAEVRLDFPGGWPGDPVNKFQASGRNEAENEAFNYLSKLAHFRKNSPALTTGKTMQYVVSNGVYVYFRYDNRQTVMVITNAGREVFRPDWNIYKERTSSFSKMKNVITGQEQALNGFSIQPGESLVMELLK